MILDSSSKSLVIDLDATVTTNQLEFSVSYAEVTSDASGVVTGTLPSGAVGVTNNTTEVTMVSAPTAGKQRIIKSVIVYNSDTQNATVVVSIKVTSTLYRVWQGIIGVGETLEYSFSSGWTVRSAQGLIKVQNSEQILTVVNTLNTTILGSAVVNDNAVANTIQDVTGLSFPVISGEMYWFEFSIFYTAAATTTGSRWSITGPATSQLVFASEYSLAATTTTRNANLLTYDLPAASNATSGSIGHNQAIIWGTVMPSSSGDVIARFASEVANSAITAKAGSMVSWRRTV